MFNQSFISDSSKSFSSLDSDRRTFRLKRKKKLSFKLAKVLNYFAHQQDCQNTRRSRIILRQLLSAYNYSIEIGQQSNQIYRALGIQIIRFSINDQTFWLQFKNKLKSCQLFHVQTGHSLPKEPLSKLQLIKRLEQSYQSIKVQVSLGRDVYGSLYKIINKDNIFDFYLIMAVRMIGLKGLVTRGIYFDDFLQGNQRQKFMDLNESVTKIMLKCICQQIALQLQLYQIHNMESPQLNMITVQFNKPIKAKGSLLLYRSTVCLLAKIQNDQQQNFEDFEDSGKQKIIRKKVRFTRQNSINANRINMSSLKRLRNASSLKIQLQDLPTTDERPAQRGRLNQRDKGVQCQFLRDESLTFFRKRLRQMLLRD